jgi:hypothetical protein
MASKPPSIPIPPIRSQGLVIEANCGIVSLLDVVILSTSASLVRDPSTPTQVRHCWGVESDRRVQGMKYEERRPSVRLA